MAATIGREPNPRGSMTERKNNSAIKKAQTIIKRKIQYFTF